MNSVTRDGEETRITTASFIVAIAHINGCHTFDKNVVKPTKKLTKSFTLLEKAEWGTDRITVSNDTSGRYWYYSRYMINAAILQKVK